MKETQVTSQFEVSNGEFTATVKDPFGFITLKYTDNENKELPKELQGWFTTQDDLSSALKSYEQKKEQAAQMAADALRQKTADKAQAKAEKELAKAEEKK